MTTTTRRRRNPTQADVIAAMLAQEVNKAQDRVQNVPFVAAGDPAREDNDRERAKAIAERNALIAIKQRIDRYLDGDLSALYE